MDFSHWGLERAPFSAGLIPPFFHESAGQAEAAARLRYLVTGNRQVGLLLGEPGTGKSLLVERFSDQTRRDNWQVAKLDAAGLSSTELLWQLASAFALGPKPSDGPTQLFHRIADFAAGAAWRPRPAVCILDNGNVAGADLQTQLLRLLRLAHQANWLTLVVVAETSAAAQLGRSLLEMVDLRIDLDPWPEQETAGYLQMALFEAGCERPIFDEEALGAIHALTHGVPRRVNRLAEQTLLIGAETHAEEATAEDVEAAFNELSFALA